MGSTNGDVNLALVGPTIYDRRDDVTLILLVILRMYVVVLSPLELNPRFLGTNYINLSWGIFNRSEINSAEKHKYVWYLGDSLTPLTLCKDCTIFRGSI